MYPSPKVVLSVTRHLDATGEVGFPANANWIASIHHSRSRYSAFTTSLPDYPSSYFRLYHSTWQSPAPSSSWLLPFSLSPPSPSFWPLLLVSPQGSRPFSIRSSSDRTLYHRLLQPSLLGRLPPPQWHPKPIEYLHNPRQSGQGQHHP